jgi:alpha-L-fucosidase
MKRREFCKLVAAATAAAVIPPATDARAAGDASTRVFNPPPKEDYAALCATPADERVFYTYSGNKVLTKKLSDASWRNTGMVRPNKIFDSVPMEAPIPDLHGQGPYEPTWDSLLQYDCPEWYRDAKFGIWNHWSPQCVPEDGDWYARNMYEQTDRKNSQYWFQREHYGPQSIFGYKDLCAQWTLLNWDPQNLMTRYKRAGAKFFFALANHHDGFDTWNSKHHQWNAQNIGPHRDVIGTWAAEARRQGLRFGVTVHKARNWWWFQVSHGCDKTGRYAGIPYDGRMTRTDGTHAWWKGFDPQQLYAPKHPDKAVPDPSYVKYFYDCTCDLIHQHNPDLLYFDDSLFPLGWAGMNIGAYFYNHNLKTHDGKMEGVINVKSVPEHLTKAVVADLERGLTSDIAKYPWQSETCIGQWHYQRGLFTRPGEYGGYMHPREVIHWMIDTVSKNGTFILNIPGKPDGTIDSKESLILDRLGDWFAINGEAIYSTRPWTIFGEGPDMIKAGTFQGNSIRKLGAKDIRFTRNKAKTAVYAIFLGWPDGGGFEVKAFGSATSTNPGKILNVSLLGTDEKLQWKQTAGGLHVAMPEYRPAVDYAAALKVSLA